ncbi:hypothetical protein NQ315_014475 [Exocentrus adspersus]|uniref:DDE Tnp4 domain-containing protein n=1 Tax=Exocentrus adspersus TaxID=1586481 RepID=A0AAV8VEV2_9CUCU|nr:hypothetical protein NQ315_014475 [Exocentrus adspersus]
MELEDMLYDDDLDIQDIIQNGFPRRRIERTDYFETMDDYGFFRRFRLTKPTVAALLEEIEDGLVYNNQINNPVSPMTQLLLTLRFFASNGHQTSIGDFIGCHQSTASRIINKVSRAIANLRPLYVKMPQTNIEKLQTQEEFYRVARFPRVIGVIDCTHVKLQSPGDSGYGLRRFLLTPLLNPQTRGDQLYNESHIRTRNIIERVNGILKRRFPVLAYGFRCNVENVLPIIVATTVLYNKARRMGEDEPPPAEGIDENILEYLVDQGNIPVMGEENNNRNVLNHRQQIIEHFFNNLNIH